MESERLLTTEDVARTLGVSVHTVALWRKKGRPSLVYIRVGRSIRYRPSDLQAYLSACASQPAPSAVTA